jgi:hypothetical protein
MPPEPLNSVIQVRWQETEPPHPEQISYDPRLATNPLFNQNKLKVGVFVFNGTAGCNRTTVPEQYRATWANSLDVAQQADSAGFEVIVP